MTLATLVPALAGVTLFVALVVAVLGLRGARNAKRKKLESALSEK